MHFLPPPPLTSYEGASTLNGYPDLPNHPLSPGAETAINETPCQIRCDTKNASLLKDLQLFTDKSIASPCEWNTLQRDVKQCTINQSSMTIYTSIHDNITEKVKKGSKHVVCAGDLNHSVKWMWRHLRLYNFITRTEIFY